MDIRFKVLTDIMKLEFRTLPLADPTILNPDATYPLWQGEWLVLGTTGTLARPGAGEPDDPAIVFPFIDMEYQYDTRALGSISVIYASVFEFMTSVYDSGHIPTAIGTKLGCGLVSNRSVLDDGTAAGAGFQVIARLTAGASGGFVKAIRIWA